MTTGMTGISKGAQWCGYARQEKEVGVTWELVGLTMGQVAVKWNAMGEWRALERVWERRAIYGAQRADRRWWETGGLDVV